MEPAVVDCCLILKGAVAPRGSNPMALNPLQTDQREIEQPTFFPCCIEIPIQDITARGWRSSSELNGFVLTQVLCPEFNPQNLQ